MQKGFKPYTGFIDITFSCYMKTYVSMLLCNAFIKNKNKIIMGHEDDIDESENHNVLAYPFEENGYKCFSLPGMYFGLFLSYKIERKVYKGFEKDTTFSINAISKKVFNLDDLQIVIGRNKFEYLLEEKKNKLKKGCLIDIRIEDLKNLIRNKIQNDYIYNLVYDEEHNTTKFNMQIEIQASDTGEMIKLLIALEYIPGKKELRLITMY